MNTHKHNASLYQRKKLETSLLYSTDEFGGKSFNINLNDSMKRLELGGSSLRLINTNKKSVASLYKNVFNSNTGIELNRMNYLLNQKLPELFQGNNGHKLSKESCENKNKILSNSDSFRKVVLKNDMNIPNNNISDLKIPLNNAIDKLIISLKDKGNYSMIKRLKQFCRTGDEKCLFYCPSCVHCRRFEGELFSVKYNLRNLTDSNLFFENLDEMLSDKFKEKFSNYINSESLKPNKDQESELFINFIQGLLDGEIKIESFLTPAFFEKFKMHSMAIGRSTDIEINKFIQLYSKYPSSIFENLNYPIKEEGFLKRATDI